MNPFAVGWGRRETRRFHPGAEGTLPSSDTLFQYRSWKVILASVVCRTSSFMMSDLNGEYPQRST